VALSVASRRPGVTWQSALWSSDFPRTRCHARDHHARPDGKMGRMGMMGKTGKTGKTGMTGE